MKKFLYLIIFLLITCMYANAENISFSNETYGLKEVNKDSGIYINRYLPASQKLENDTVITVCYYPKETNLFDFINEYMKDFGSNPNLNMLSFIPDVNTFSYGIINQKGNSGFIEYNIVKCQEGKKGGIYTIQFSKKYSFNDKTSFLKSRDNCYKENLKYLDTIVKTQIPSIVKNKK